MNTFLQAKTGGYNYFGANRRTIIKNIEGERERRKGTGKSGSEGERMKDERGEDKKLSYRLETGRQQRISL